MTSITMNNNSTNHKPNEETITPQKNALSIKRFFTETFIDPMSEEAGIDRKSVV